MIEDFIFDGQKLSGFGYVICSFGSVGMETTPVSELNFSTVKAANSDITHKVSSSHNENLSKTIQIMKRNCSDIADDYRITNDDISALTKWLCRKDYKWFRWVESNDDDEIFYEVKIDLRQILLSDDRLGVELTITANRPYGVTREIKSVRDFTSDTPITCSIYSDEEGYIYPDMIITLKESGDLKIHNAYENRDTYIGGCTKGEVITIHGGDTLQIESSVEDHKLSESFNYKFPRLCNAYGKSENIITSSLNCTIEFRYRGIRKVGI